jgi:anthranilate synthase/aminodeoxychorismate synthase-like glutamine amidotransferase
MIVLIDNYDSFTYNLVQIMAGQGADVRVFRNDAITVDEVEALRPAGVVVSPGPCTPREAGISVETIRRFRASCRSWASAWGTSRIGAAFGATVERARIMHGKTSHGDARRLDALPGLKNPFPAGRYHSLAVRARRCRRADRTPRARTARSWACITRAPDLRRAVPSRVGADARGKRLLRNFLHAWREHGPPGAAGGGEMIRKGGA